MKRWIWITVVMLLTMLTAGCGKKETASEELSGLAESPYGSWETDDRVLAEMQFPDYVKEDSEIYCILENQTSHAIAYDHPVVEILMDGIWNSIPYKENYVHEGILQAMGGNSKVASKVYLSDYEFSFPYGHYRTCMAYSLTADATFDHIAFAEFDIVEDETRIQYEQFVEQTYEPDKAYAEGCAVMTGDTVLGQEIIDEFFDLSLTGASCEMRLVLPDDNMCQHYSFKDGCYTVQNYVNQGVVIYCYSGLYYDAELEEVFLSNYGNPEEARSLGFVVNEPEDIYQFGEVHISMAARERSFLQVYLYNSEKSLILYTVDDTFHLGYQTPGEGKTVPGYWLFSQLHPISIRAISEDAALVQFASPDGTTDQKIFDFNEGGWKE